jgi:transcriptional regulator with XRE-family HTH domain
LEPRTRRAGCVLDGDRLEAELGARGLEARDLAKLTGLTENTIVQARNGRRISRDTLMRISDALLKVPAHPMAAVLTGRDR